MPIPISGRGEVFLAEGPGGRIETMLDYPEPATPARGLALVAHPHPLFGGSSDNKVVQTLAKTFLDLGYIAARPNFRGVGASEGTHDEGDGETEDLLVVLGALGGRFAFGPPVLSGFSFGAFVQTRVARRIVPERMVLVGVAHGRVVAGRTYATEPVPANTLVLHGELDETVPLANVLDWARPQDLPVVVVPGCNHFFDRKLHHIRSIVKGSWQR